MVLSPIGKGVIIMTEQNDAVRDASEQVCAEEYVVKRGDSFYTISHKLGVPLRDLLAANRDIHPARLMVGDILCVPREEDDAPQNGASSGNGTSNGNGVVGDGTALDQNTVCPMENRVTLSQGETVADIQLTRQLNRSTLQRANPNVDLDSLTEGAVVCVPDENRPCALPSTYAIASGETLETVAVKFNLPIASLLRANPCLAPQDFEQGTTIILPK